MVRPRYWVITTRLPGASASAPRQVTAPRASRKVLMRGLSRLLPARRVERFWLALYGMDRSTAERRARFLEKVKRRVAALR